MSEYKRELVVVLDASAIFTGLPQYLPAKYVTTESVVNEILDVHSRQVFENLISANRVEVRPVSLVYKEKAIKKARDTGLLSKLSDTDIDLLALAMEIRDNVKNKVIVATDDYALQNILLLEGFYVLPTKTSGIRNTKKYKTICPACGYQGSSDERRCPVCGTPLIIVALRLNKKR